MTIYIYIYIYIYNTYIYIYDQLPYSPQARPEPCCTWLANGAAEPPLQKPSRYLHAYI